MEYSTNGLNDDDIASLNRVLIKALTDEELLRISRERNIGIEFSRKDYDTLRRSIYIHQAKNPNAPLSKKIHYVSTQLKFSPGKKICRKISIIITIIFN